jgi:ATP-binding cassette subfamily F protein 3
MVPKVRDILGAFLFGGDDVHKKVAVLSGGERNRLALAILLLRPANLLLLDEPTNHLDLQSKEVLLRSLKHYPGTLVFVSHDRYFVDALATRIVEVKGGQIDSCLGNYEDFLRLRQARGDLSHSLQRVELEASAGPAGESADKDDRKRGHEERKEAQRNERRRQKDLAELEGMIEAREEALAALEEQMADPELYRDAEGWRRTSTDHARLKDEIDTLYQRWDVLQPTGPEPG